MDVEPLICANLELLLIAPHSYMLQAESLLKTFKNLYRFLISARLVQWYIGSILQDIALMAYIPREEKRN